MKLLRLLFAVVALMAVCMGAGAQNLRDANYALVGKISPNGVLRDAKGVTAGYFNANGDILNRKSVKVGHIGRDMQVLDAAGNRIGYLTVDGVVHDGESRTLGHIDMRTGKVTDAQYHIVGYGDNLNIVWIGCYFFFNFFK